ncbi:MAG: hypothetical protein JSS68_18950 [Actinobacteria bacterium]|nr:hypothetical protein [Actinomycetota bacterium]
MTDGPVPARVPADAPPGTAQLPWSCRPPDLRLGRRRGRQRLRSNATGVFGRAALTGGEGSVIAPTPIPAEEPSGSAIDAQTGKIFWGDVHSNTIKYANLDGSGSSVLPTGAASVDGPNNPVVDLATGRIYWANAFDDTISWANLDGTGGGNLNTGAAPIEEPWGVAVDPAANRIYWANLAGNTIAYANLDGSGGGGQVLLSANYAREPDGVAINPANQTIYWTNFEGGRSEGSIGWARLAFPEAGLAPLPVGAVVEPGGLAIAGGPYGRGQIYWTNEGGNEGIFSASAEGSAVTEVSTNGAPLAHPSSPSLLAAPSVTRTPLPFGSLRSIGMTLGCGSPGWAEGGVESHLYRAPQSQSFSWTLEGVTLDGATGETLTASQPGTYVCRATASNEAGSTTITMATYRVAAEKAVQHVPRSPQIEGIEVARDKRDGTATLLVAVSGPGALSVSGPQVVHRIATATGAGLVKLRVTAKGKALHNLRKTGRRTVKVAIEFATTSGHFVTSRSITLRRPVKPRRHHKHPAV